MPGYYELKRATGSQFMFNLKAANHQVVLTSETYTSKQAALDGIESVRKNAADDARFVRKTAKDDSPYFVLTAANGQVIGKSETYSSPESMEKGIAAVMKLAANAETVDHSATMTAGSRMPSQDE